jgi:CspA family cold shock protein
MTLLGVVESFDDTRGDGWLRSEADERFYFHCVEIADGSRTIAQGTRVRALRAVGHVGRDEAAQLTSIV